LELMQALGSWPPIWLREIVAAGLEERPRTLRVNTLEQIDRLAWADRFGAIDVGLEGLDPNKLHDLSIVCLLRGTFSRRRRLPHWHEFRDRCAAVLRARGHHGNAMDGLDEPAPAATRPTSPGDDVEALRAEIVAPDDLGNPDFGRNLFREVIGESYTPHVWGNHRALHHTSVRFALDMADRGMPEVADVLRALIWKQVIVDNRASHASEAQRAAEDRATAAEAALAKAREVLKDIRDEDWVENCPDPQRPARLAASALTPTDGGAHDDR
jgi:hypothetical protein